MLSTYSVRAQLEQLRLTRPSGPSPIERWHGIEAESDGTSGGWDAALDAIARRYLARLLGRPPTREDAALLPGIDVSDL